MNDIVKIILAILSTLSAIVPVVTPLLVSLFKKNKSNIALLDNSKKIDLLKSYINQTCISFEKLFPNGNGESKLSLVYFCAHSYASQLGADLSSFDIKAYVNELISVTNQINMKGE